MENKKNILIVGSSSVLIKKIKDYDNVGKIYVNTKIVNPPQNVEYIDIRDDSTDELLKFAFENNINLTIALSKKAISADIAGIFSANGQMVFAPEYNCAKYFIDKAALKKLLYKLNINSSKFGVFDKSQAALDYLKTTELPVIVSSTMPESANDLYACPTVSVGSIAVNDLFFRGEEKILIDEYLSGRNFTTYILTDGVASISVGTLATGKFSDDVEGGFITMGSYASLPDTNITRDIENYILYEVWEKISAYFEKGQNSFVGIVGISGVLKNDELFITDIQPVINPVDAPILINCIDENLINLFEACAIGSFTDDFDFIKTDDYSYVSLALFSNSAEKELNFEELLSEPENLDLSVKIFNNKYFSRKGFVGTLWAKGKTLTSAKKKLADNTDVLTSYGIKFRKDVIGTKNI